MNLPPGKPLFHGSYEYTAYTPEQVREIERGIKDLKKQLKEAKRDSEMLDWLQNTKFKVSIDELEDKYFELKRGDNSYYGISLRLAIQNAMKEGK